MITADTMDAVSDAVLKASWQASVLAVVVLVVVCTVGRRFPARWRYNLWLLVVLRLCLPVTPASPVSLFNLAGMGSAAAETPLIMREPATSNIELDHGLVVPLRFDGEPARIVNLESRSLRWWDWALLVWLAGMVVMLLRAVVASVRLHRMVRRLRPVTDPEVLELLRRCQQEVNVRRGVRVVRMEGGVPAVVGWIRPRLLLPEGILRDFSARELRPVLLHELEHVRRHDVGINYLATFLQALHWFNPTLYLVFRRLRLERELACDERVLALTKHGEERRSYGHTLLRLLQQTPGQMVSPGAIGIVQAPHVVRRRILMIADFRPGQRWTLPAAGLIVALSAVLLTDRVGAQSEPVRPTEARPADAPATAGARNPLEAAPGGENAVPGAPAMVPFGPGFNPYGSAASAPKRPVRAAARPSMATATQVEADERALRQKLGQRLPEARFEAVPFEEFVAYLRDVTQMNILVNWRALESEGIERNTPVSLALKDVTVEQVLRLAARELGGGGIRLGHAIEHGVLVITTADDLSVNPQLEVYDVSELLSSAMGSQEELRKQLIDTIQASVDPGSWTQQGGHTGNISMFGQKLSITQTPENHQAIQALLMKLRAQPNVLPAPVPIHDDHGHGDHSVQPAPARLEPATPRR